MAFTFQRLSETMKATVNSDGRLVKEYNTTYLCKNNVEMTCDEVAAGVGILPGAPHITWTFATCNSIEVTRRLTRVPKCAWDAKYVHSTAAAVPADAADAAPALRRVNRSTGTSERQTYILRDKNGVMILDAAGSPFDGGVPVTEWLGTISWKRDEVHTSTSMSQAVALSGKINSDVFMGCAIGTLILKVTGEEKWEGTYHFWTFTYEMTYDKAGHDPRPLNAGLWKKVSGNRVRITEYDGTDSAQPQPLTTGGDVIPVASRPGSCNFITVEHHNTLAFATLGLPTT